MNMITTIKGPTNNSLTLSRGGGGEGGEGEEEDNYTIYCMLILTLFLLKVSLIRSSIIFHEPTVS